MYTYALQQTLDCKFFMDETNLSILQYDLLVSKIDLKGIVSRDGGWGKALEW
jgi:hypothetical protein